MGGHGYSRFNLIGALRNNNDINTTWEGDNTVLIQQTGKFILENFKQKMKGKNPSEKYSTLKFLDSFETLSDKPSVRITSAADLDDFSQLKRIFEYKINFNLQRTVMKLSSRVEEKKDELLVAWNNSQVYYIQPLVKSYIENFVFDSFRGRIESIQGTNESTASTKKMLGKFLKLYSLSIFNSDMTVLRNEDYLSSESVYIIKEEILDLCESLKDEFIGIIDCIAAPDEVLNAPLGRSDGRIWESYLNKVFAFNKSHERPDWWENLHHKNIKEKY